MSSADGDVSDALVAVSQWTDQDLLAHGIPIRDVPLVSVGGGLGSFALVDMLRVAGIATNQMRVISDISSPTETYEYLASNSQIRPEHRLRSDSGSVIDCLWGWPGYALREAVQRGRPARAMQVLVEPLLAEWYTPEAGQVYASVQREAARIAWPDMLWSGIARHVRKRIGGGYFVLFTPPAGHAQTRRIAIRCQFVHLAVGYPGVRFLDDLQEYRTRTNDFGRVVNAYEPHDHVYAQLRQRPGTVMVRGSGIVASRVLQRLIEDREHHGAATSIVHLFRTYPDGPQGDTVTFRRPASRGWAYQGFNFPKASWGGQLRDQLEGLEGADRATFIDRIGGTNTAPRTLWRAQLRRGEQQGFYRQAKGVVSEVTAIDGSPQIRTHLANPDGTAARFDTDFIIDATGLESDIEEHRVLGDLLRHADAAKNPKGRLDVERDFAVRGAANEPGHMFASGSATLGGYYAGVDSFLGLQYAALRIHDSLAAAGFGQRIRSGRSVSQWWRWARNVAP